MSGLTKSQLQMLKERYAVKLETVPCKHCGSTQLCVYGTQQNGKPLLVALCIRCGHYEKLPRFTLDEAPNMNRMNDWAKVVKARDDYRCVICGSNNRVQAHHIIPRSHDRLGEWWYTPTNGITVCRRCHELIHGEWMTKYRKDYEH